MTETASSPLSLFDIPGRVAIVTGASGAFGAFAAQTLAAAGAKLGERVYLTTGNPEAMRQGAVRAWGTTLTATQAQWGP